MLHPIPPMPDLGHQPAAAEPAFTRAPGDRSPAEHPLNAPSIHKDLTARAEAVAEQLRQAFTPVVHQCVGPGLRPASLARALGIDRTLAARILRALRAQDSVQLLHETPAPGGLRIFLDAAVAAGLPPRLAEPAALCIRHFEQLIDEFPGGRAALDALLGGLDEGVLQRNSRAAAQSIHRSMTSLLGFQADVMLATALIQPSADGRSLDVAYILGKFGVRRLRHSPPITVFGWRADIADPHTAAGRRIETVDGRLDPENGSAYLLSEYCSRPTPPLSLFRAENLYLYTLAASVPPVNVPVNLVSAQVVRNSGPRFRNDRLSYHWETHTPRFPCKVLVADVLVRDDALGARPPIITTRLHSIASGAGRPDAPAFQLDNVDLAPPVTVLDGLAGVATRDVPNYAPMLDGVFTQLGWDASRFSAYRCRMQYPVPLVSVTFWFDLPAEPGTEQS